MPFYKGQSGEGHLPDCNAVTVLPALKFCLLLNVLLLQLRAGGQGHRWEERI